MNRVRKGDIFISNDSRDTLGYNTKRYILVLNPAFEKKYQTWPEMPLFCYGSDAALCLSGYATRHEEVDWRNARITRIRLNRLRSDRSNRGYRVARYNRGDNRYISF